MTRQNPLHEKCGLIGFVLMVAISAAIGAFYTDRKFPASQKYSTFGPRFWSGPVDGCVLWPVGFVFSLLAGFAGSALLATTLIVAQNLVGLAYTVGMHTKYGQTVGKMACRVRVLDFDGEGRISFRQALVRESIPIVLNLIMAAYATYTFFGFKPTPGADQQISFRHFVPMFLLGSLSVLWFLLEIVTMLTNDKRRALHDFIAGTVVVRTNLDDRLPSKSPSQAFSPGTPVSGNPPKLI